jgi:hypothetical protein
MTETNSLIQKKAILDKIFYEIGKQKYDFFVCGTFEKEGEKKFTKWEKFSETVFPINFNGDCIDWKKRKFFENINQRQILPCEIVLDLEKERKEREKEELIQTLLRKYYDEERIKNLIVSCKELRLKLGLKEGDDNHILILALGMYIRHKEHLVKSRLKRIAKAVNKKNKRVKNGN